MIILAAIALLAPSPSLEEVRTCQAHVALIIEDVAREGRPVAGPTWFIRDWWDQQAEEAGAPEDDTAAVSARKAELERGRTLAPEAFQAGRGRCVDLAIDAGAVPGMARVSPV